MKIARLTSPLLDALRRSSPRPRLTHGRQLAFLFHLNLYTLFFAGSLSSSPNFPNCSSPRESVSAYAALLRSHFSVSQPKALSSRARGYLSELRRATWSLTRLFALLYLPLNFLRLPPTFPPSLPLAQTKLPIPC